MPVAIKLSKAFYDRFGHEAADELVGVLNQVDAASQNSLRELNELNFARFDAKLEQRIAELRAEVANLATQLRDQQVVHMRWMIGIWVAAVIGIWLRR